jgi:hypothetical protein
MGRKDEAARIVDEKTVTKAVAQYIAATFGATYGIHSVNPTGATWWVRIHCRHPELDEPVVVGSVRVVALTGQVVPLTAPEINDIQERAAILVAHRRQELARDLRGYILPSQAKLKATGYVAQHIAHFATAEEQPQWVEGAPPIWRVATALWLRGQGRVCELGTVDVNALTGEVLPLSKEEITTRQKRARHAAEAVARSAAATG